MSHFPYNTILTAMNLVLIKSKTNITRYRIRGYTFSETCMTKRIKNIVRFHKEVVINTFIIIGLPNCAYKSATWLGLSKINVRAGQESARPEINFRITTVSFLIWWFWLKHSCKCPFTKTYKYRRGQQTKYCPMTLSTNAYSPAQLCKVYYTTGGLHPCYLRL